MPVIKEDIPAVESQEIEATVEYVTVPLAGYDGVTKDVRARPAMKWRASALRALNSGDMDGFMGLVLHENDVQTYEDLDPDMDAVGHFAQSVGEASGEALGKSSGPRRSSKNTRKR